MRRPVRVLLDAAFRPVDAASLAVFRVAYGVVLVWEVLRYLSYGWVSEYYMEPDFHFRYIYFEWVEPWAGGGMIAHFVVLGLLGLLIAVGWWTRAALALFSLGMGYVFLLEQAHYLNHIYLVVMFSGMLAFLPLDGMLSLRAWRRPQARSETVPAWALWLVRFQIFVVYFYGGLAKLNWDWLRGQPMILWMARRHDMPVVGELISLPEVARAMGHVGLVYDLAVGPLLLWRRTRTMALVVSFTFHLSNHFLFSIGIFPWLMMAATLLFLDPDWPRRALPGVLARLHLPAPPAAGAAPGTRRLPVLIVGGLFVAYNLLFPLRHLLYPGSPSWTEEGHRYAWHMKLRSKSGKATFEVEHLESGETWTVDPADHLSDRQYGKMRSRPDMILQFAHHLRDQAEQEGRGQVAVRARVQASLNGRRSQDLIDPTVDLAQVERDLLPASWIVPLKEPLPGRSR